MCGYLINRFDITDREGFLKYVAAVVPIIEAHQGDILLGNQSARALEGSSPRMTVVIRSPRKRLQWTFMKVPNTRQ
jgi:uncharacterized protein (DUF1330 family)